MTGVSFMTSHRDSHPRDPDTAVQESPCSEQQAAAPESPWMHQQLRVPRTDGALLAHPGLTDAADAALANAAQLADYDLDLQGRSLSQLRTWARQSLLQRAVQFTSELREETVPLPETDRENWQEPGD